jgi:TctA family transporter
LLAPLVIAVVFLAAFQASVQFGDMIALLFFSILGWFMKRFGWPRPPVILGLVLSKIIENYLYISVGAYGLTWLYRPLVLLIMLITAVSLVFGVRQTRRKTVVHQQGGEA